MTTLPLAETKVITHRLQDGPDARRDARRSIAQGLFVAGAAACLLPGVTPPVALAGGIALGLLVGNPFKRESHRVAKTLLQVCVVVLGFGMDLPTVLRAGAGGAVLAAATIAITLAAGWALGRWLKLRPITTALISVGTAICGGSAIAAVGSTLDADEGDLTVAMGTVFLLNAAALYAFPIAGHALGLTQHQFGTWAGVGIHDVSSVVGAAGHYGPEALQVATAVKLSRALWIVPLTIGMGWAMRGRRTIQLSNASFGFDAPKQVTPRKTQVPWFIGLFLAASIVRSLVPTVAGIAPTLTHGATIGLTLTLFLIGAGITRETVAAVGWKSLSLGVTLWALISGISLAAVLVDGR